MIDTAMKLGHGMFEAKPHSFIYELPMAIRPEDCARMIEQFEASPDEHHTGRVGMGKYEPELKQSTDLYLSGQEQWKWADDILVQSMRDGVGYVDQIFPIFREDRLEDNGYQIQRTSPGEFYHWHKDLNQHSRRRVMVLLWYLNDVPKAAGGATEFLHQGVSIQPEAGKLLMFPPYWTHVHRGAVLKSGVKYVATTWVCYAGANDYNDEGVEYGDGWAKIE